MILKVGTDIYKRHRGRNRRFFGRRLDVVSDDDSPNPAKFMLEGETHVVSEILLMWHDYSFPSDSRRHRWWQREHRNDYRLRTSQERIFELYFDRGTGKKSDSRFRCWYITREFRQL